MRHKLLSVITLIAILLQVSSSAYAHEFPQQEKDLQKVLFGRDNYAASQEKPQHDAIIALVYAQNLVTDEFNGNTQPVFNNTRLAFLLDYGVPGIPNNVSEFDFSCNSGHEKFVNVRWNPYVIPERGNWPVRKNILPATVNKVFDFGFGTDIFIFSNQPLVPYSEQCDALSALLFYIHQLGDIQTTTYKAYVFPLARAHVGEDNADILWDLMQVYLPKLFPTQIHSDEYTNLMSELREISIDARALTGSTGGLNTLKKQKQNAEYAGKVIDILAQYIPKLLHRESFFLKVFPE